MKDSRLGWMLVLALCLGFVVVEARGDDASRADVQAFLSQLRMEAADKPLARRPARPTGITGEKADCTAQCGNGVTVTVTNCSSCTAVDRNCSFDQRGYAQCTGGSPVYCPEDCSTTCFVETPCPEGGGVWCEGTTSCEGGEGLCYVRCDGVYKFCPGHFGQRNC